MKFRVTTKSDAVAESNGSSYISKSGIYDVTIKFASLDVAGSGAESVNFNLDYNGNSQTIYGPYVTNKNGDVNEIGAKLINKLAVIIGMGDGDEFDIDEETHNVGRDNKPQDFNVITNFSDTPIKIRLQEEYSKYNGEIKKRMVIRNFFREDGAAAEEIVADTEIGKRLALEEEKWASDVTYKDGLTAEDIAEWLESKRSEGNSGSKTPKPKATPAKKSGSLFK